MEPRRQEENNIDILSFDGGGSRGIMEVSILSDVMRLATILWRDPEALSYLADVKDLGDLGMRKRLINELAAVENPIHPTVVYNMIVGTSTGALISFGLVGGNSDEKDNRLTMTLEECIKMYKEKTERIFRKSWKKWFLSWIPGLGGVPITPYPQDNVNEVLDYQFGNSSLADFRHSRTVAGAVARKIGENEELVMFDTKTDAYKLYTTSQVLLATSNAPVYFDTPVKIGDKEFVDGGVGGNCPLAQAIPRAKSIFGDEMKITTAFSIAPPAPNESHVPSSFQWKYWLNYFVEQSTSGYAAYLDAKRSNKGVRFRRLAPRGESLKSFKLDEIDAEKMLKAMEDEKLNNDMFLVDIIAKAAFVVDTYLAKVKEQRDATAKVAAKLAYTAAKIHASKFEYKLAYASYETSLSLWKRLAFEESKIVVPKLYDDMADCLADQGKYQRACKIYRRSVEYWRKYSDNVHEAKASFKLAECLLLSSLPEEAEKIFEAVLVMQREIYGEDKANCEVASTFNGLGWCHRMLKKLDEAKTYCLKALEMRNQLYPNGEHLEIAQTLNSLGLIHSELGKHDEAVKYAQDALEMRKNVIKERDHNLIAESLNNLGWCLLSKSEYVSAREKLEMALTMKKLFYGDIDHPSIAISLENLAKCLLYTDEKPQVALEYAQQALNMKRACSGDERNVSDQAIAKTLDIIARCFQKAGDHRKAIQFSLAARRMKNSLP